MAGAARIRYKDLSLAQLRSFCEVCRLGGFAAAAETLHLTSPAVWEQVRAIEGQYGARLLERRGNQVRPTAEGKLLLEMLRPILAELDSTREVICQQAGTLPARITVVSSLRVQLYEILRALRQFRCRYPGIGLRIREVDSGEVAPLLLDGSADLAVMLKPGPPDPVLATISYEIIHGMDFLLVTPPGHALLRKRPLRIHDIVKYPLVLGRPEAFSRRRFEEVLHSQNLGADVTVAVETSSGSLTLAAVREGMGVGIVACTPHGVLTRGLGVRSLRRWFGQAQVVFARKRGARVPPVHQELAQAIRDSIAQGVTRG
jgi:DNA-binding transcriptional LysR family regulator